MSDKKNVFSFHPKFPKFFHQFKNLFVQDCLLIYPTIVDVLSILKWIDTFYMSLQYTFNANKALFISITFIYLFDSSALQCPPVECQLYVSPQPVKHASEKISVLARIF